MTKAYSEMLGLRSLLLMISLTILSPLQSLRAAEPQAKDALEWVMLVDSGAFDQSWMEASSLFKGAVTQAQWRTLIPTVRKPLGPVISRSLQSMTPHTQLPGAPDGHYRVLQFETRFAQKQSAVETIVLMLEESRGWRVSGYFIR